MGYTFQFGSVLGYWPQFLEGAWLTIRLSALAMAFGLTIGIACALARSYGAKPLAWAAAIYVEGIDPAVAAAFGTIVARPDEADVAVVRLATPHEPAAALPEAFFHQGSLALPAAESGRLVGVMTTVPTVVCLFLERAAVVPEIAEHAAAFVVDYAAEDLAVLDVVFGHAVPEGRLPVELPRTMADVENHPEDLPGGFADPLFPLGHRLPATGWRPRQLQPTA